MVRPALKGNGALFPAIAALFRVSTAWPTAHETTMMTTEMLQNLIRTRLRFPQGSGI
jgi:hypothetical protein